MRYVDARIEQEYRDSAYRIYVTDSLYGRAINQHPSKRYVDIINHKPEDDRSGDEIAMEIFSGAGLELVDGPI